MLKFKDALQVARLLCFCHLKETAREHLSHTENLDLRCRGENKLSQLIGSKKQNEISSLFHEFSLPG
jgi:hypothetical protein